MGGRANAADAGWVSLNEACRLLGVSPSTVRRWGDTGLVRTFVTPGGHRRFSRQGLEALLPDQPTGHPSLAALGETPVRMARGYRRAADTTLGEMPWVANLDREQRDRFRRFGRSMIASLVVALDAGDPEEREGLLQEAEIACSEYGRVAARQRLDSATTADMFLRFRRPFLDELGALARRRELDASATVSLIAEANAALDGLLVTTLHAWQVAMRERSVADRTAS